MMRLRECKIAGGGKIIAPLKIPDGDGKLAGNSERLIGAAGIDEDDLVNLTGQRSQAVRNEMCLIANDEAR